MTGMIIHCIHHHPHRRFMSIRIQPNPNVVDGRLISHRYYHHSFKARHPVSYKWPRRVDPHFIHSRRYRPYWHNGIRYVRRGSEHSDNGSSTDSYSMLWVACLHYVVIWHCVHSGRINCVVPLILIFWMVVVGMDHVRV